MKFRHARPDDVDRIIDLTIMMCKEIHYDYNADDIQTTVSELMGHDNIMMLVMANDDDLAVAIIVLHVSPSMFNQGIMEASELWFYLSKPYVHMGLRMIKYTESQLQKDTEFSMCFTQKKASAILQKNGYIKKSDVLFKEV